MIQSKLIDIVKQIDDNTMIHDINNMTYKRQISFIQTIILNDVEYRKSLHDYNEYQCDCECMNNLQCNAINCEHKNRMKLLRYVEYILILNHFDYEYIIDNDNFYYIQINSQ